MEFNEKRAFVRMQADCNLSYRLSGDGKYVEGACLNISGSGILFRGRVPLEPGKAAEIHLVPENRIIPPLTAYIEVTRCDPVMEERYDIAGMIKGIKSE